MALFAAKRLRVTATAIADLANVTGGTDGVYVYDDGVDPAITFVSISAPALGDYILQDIDSYQNYLVDKVTFEDNYVATA